MRGKSAWSVVVTSHRLGGSAGPGDGGCGRARFGLERRLAGSVAGDVEDGQGSGVVLGAGTRPQAGGGWRADSLVLLAAGSASSSGPAVPGQYRSPPRNREHGGGPVAAGSGLRRGLGRCRLAAAEAAVRHR